jgi:hypothetical protein
VIIWKGGQQRNFSSFGQKLETFVEVLCGSGKWIV